MDKIAPKWVVCISFAIFCATGLFMIFDFFRTLIALISNSSTELLAILIAQAIIFYFAIYIPTGIINRYLKQY